MKTIIKLLIAAAVLNAVVRSGLVALDYYQFEDAAQQAVLFAGDGDAGVTQVRDQILQRAVDYGVPITPEGLTVRRDGALTIVDATYTDAIELFPGYRYPLTLSFSVEARRFNTANAKAK